MFRLYPEKYRVIKIDYHNKENWKKDVYAELKTELRVCPIKGYPCVHSHGEKDTHLLFGLEEGVPTKFHIDRKRYECPECGKTFFADYGHEDFGSNEHTLPEFIKFLIKEWLKDKNASFNSIGEKYSYSRETVSNWCNMLLSTFKEKTKCEAGKIMVFSSFHYKENDVIRTHAVVCKSLTKSYRVCGFLDDYEKYNRQNLKKAMDEQFTRLNSIERIIYDYFPGVNIAIQGIAPNGADVMVDGDRLYDNLKTMIKKCEKIYKEDLERVFYQKKARNAKETLDEIKEWCNNLKPDSVACVVHEYLWPLLEKTPDHFLCMLFESGAYEDDFMTDITGLCEKRSGKKEPYESMKLRALYDNVEYKQKVLEHLIAMPIKDAEGKKQKTKKKDASTASFIIGIDDFGGFSKKRGRIESAPSRSTSSHDNLEDELQLGTGIDFIDNFTTIDPNEAFAKMPKIKNWSVDVRRLFEVLEDEGNEWLSMDD